MNNQDQFEVRPIDSITIANRFRRSLGNLGDLVASIREVGLLHPIVITPEGLLVAGARRLAAVKELGWTEVSVHVAASLEDARARLLAERDENNCRLAMTSSELVALGKALEAIEGPQAAARKSASQAKKGVVPSGGDESSPPGTDARRGRTRDLVATALGISGQTYTRAKAVVAAKEHADPAVREAAKAAAEEMDRTGNVSRAYAATCAAVESLKRSTRSREPEETPVAGQPMFRRPRKRPKVEQIRNLMTTLPPFGEVFKGVTYEDLKVDWAEVTEWRAVTKQFVRTLNAFNRALPKTPRECGIPPTDIERR